MFQIMCSSILLIIILLSIFFLIKTPKNTVGKFISILICSIFYFPWIIFILDSSNFFSNLDLYLGVNYSEWRNYIFMYTSQIFAALIGGYFIVLWGKHQITQEMNNNLLLERERSRISIMPLLKYKIEKSKINTNVCAIYKGNGNANINTKLTIENIGLNTCRDIEIILKSYTLNINYKFELKQQGIINKNCKESLDLQFINMNSKNFDLNLEIEYKDLLLNKYSQSIHLVINKTLNSYRIETLKIDKEKYIIS